VVIDDDAWQAIGDVTTVVQRAATALAAAPGAGVAAGMTAVVALGSDADVQVLNKQYRNQDKPTNVLSFPSGDASRQALGDIILARETVEAEARALALPIAHHIQHLIVHGLLHLLGFDHDTDTDAQRMEAIETKVLAGLGIADPYAEPT
jgi:probable rRNA maturation factor